MGDDVSYIGSEVLFTDWKQWCHGTYFSRCQLHG
jgi:hypothetical protein